MRFVIALVRVAQMIKRIHHKSAGSHRLLKAIEFGNVDVPLFSNFIRIGFIVSKLLLMLAKYLRYSVVVVQRRLVINTKKLVGWRRFIDCVKRAHRL